MGGGRRKNSKSQKFPCITCKKEVTSDSIQCDGCEEWVHSTQTCSGLTKNLATELLGNDCNAIQYLCSSCRASSIRPTTAMKSIVDNMKPMMENMKQLTLSVQGLAASVAEIQSWKQETTIWRNQVTQQLNTLSSNTSQTDSDTMRSLIRSEMLELRERDKRKETVVVKGITFSSEGEFLNNFNRVSEALTGKVMVPEEVFPINSKIVRMKIANRDDRMLLLKSSPKLKHTRDHAHIYISRDLTYQQRKELLSRRNNSKTISTNNNEIATGANSVPLPLSFNFPKDQLNTNSNMLQDKPSLSPSAPPLSLASPPKSPYLPQTQNSQTNQPILNGSSVDTPSRFRSILNFTATPPKQIINKGSTDGPPNDPGAVSSEVSTED